MTLYRSGLSLTEVAEKLGVDPKTVQRDLEKLGVDRRQPRPRPFARTCEREGCTNQFVPTWTQLKRGYGLYCSHSCDGEAHRIHPKPIERTCEREGCDVVFTPESDLGLHDAKGWNRYCSRRCKGIASRGRDEKATKGRLITCDNCGKQQWRYDHQLKRDRGEKEGWFCSKRCHGSWRTTHEWPGARRQLTAIARMKFLGRINGQKVDGQLVKSRAASRGRTVGKPAVRHAAMTDEKRAQIRKLWAEVRPDGRRRHSQRKIAYIVDASRGSVENEIKKLA